MGLGSTAKKLQTLADRAEQLYKQLNDLRERVVGLEETTEETGDRVRRLEHRFAEQQALLELLAEKEGIDVESIKAEAAIEEAEAPTTEPSTDGEADGAESDDGDTETVPVTDGDESAGSDEPR